MRLIDDLRTVTSAFNDLEHLVQDILEAISNEKVTKDDLVKLVEMFDYKREVAFDRFLKVMIKLQRKYAFTERYRSMRKLLKR